ncbi:MAG: S-methyl-5'-thioadenosine phosphorylase, partial [Candidatus Daviesbacteria bacterium]|nr:S-methyl-5'-thioadenosine phosphorylase [Candidatus Daviesbacteria bacterium]
MTKNKKTGIIGGSGLDNPKLLKNAKVIEVKTPYGKPSDKLSTGLLGGKEVVILARHAKGHNIAPSQIPFRANIWALKEAGCTHILATTACGSLKENFKPGDLVFIDQFIDFTRQRALTFFDNEVIHTPMAEPFDLTLRNILVKAAKTIKVDYHPKGTMITIEGPRFSTKAESIMFQKWGADLINMSTVPEVTLANELKIPYQTIAMVTDYDCWREGEEAVSFELILERMQENAEKVKRLLIETIA